MRTFYSTYVSHALRFYAKYPENPVFRSEADRLNHSACHQVLDDHPSREFVLAFYRGECEKFSHKLTSHDWKIIADVERRVASVRGLI